VMVMRDRGGGRDDWTCDFIVLDEFASGRSAQWKEYRS